MEESRTPGTDELVQYTETVVEYVDNRRQRVVLALVLIVLFILLLGSTYFVLAMTKGKGAPKGSADVPQGLTWVRSIYGWGNSLDEALISPTDVAIAEDGKIWVVSNHSVIAGFNPDGSAYRVFRPKGVASLEGIDVGDNGHIYVTDFGGQVLQYSTTGEQLDQWKVELPNEIHVVDGKIAVAAAKGVAVFTPEGEMLLQLGGDRGWADEQFDLPHGIFLAEDGTLYVSDTQNRRLKAYSQDGRLLWASNEAPDRSRPGVADVRSTETSVGASTFLLPSGMTRDGNGRLVVVDPFKFRIAVIDPETGKVAKETPDDGKPGRQAFYGDQGSADGFFAYPTGIDYDKTRDWFAVADTYNNRVQILRIPGSGGSALAPLLGEFRWPMCILCVPWLLLLLALGYLLRKRRRQETDQEVGEVPATEG